MNLNNEIDLTFSKFLSFKPMVFAKVTNTDLKCVLKSIQVAIPVPNSSFCIDGAPALNIFDERKEIVLNVAVRGVGKSKQAGQMLYFRQRPKLDLPDGANQEYDLIVIVNRNDDTRPTQVGKSVVRTIDEED